MGYNRLYIWVEGNDGERFFKRIIVPRFNEKYDLVEAVLYAQETRKWINNFLKSIKKMNADYIFVADINSEPCVTAKKQKLQNKYREVNEHRIMVVIKEIEGWYLAGLDHTSSEKLGVPCLRSSDTITKEDFASLQPKQFDSRIDFMSEILKHFSVETAKQKNESLKYFVEKYDCRPSQGAGNSR